MPIYKARVNSDYVVLPNQTIQDKRLTFEARGLLGFLLSLPEDWAIHKEWLIKQSPSGRDKLTRMLVELTDNGYLTKTTKHDETGKITGMDWFVYPYDTVRRLLSTTDNQLNGKPATTKETVKQSKQLNKDDGQDHRTRLVEESFEFFWKYWKSCKKEIGKTDTTPKGNTFDKKWKVMFNSTYWKTHNEEQFRKEVNDMADFCKDAHAVQGFNRFQNMQMPAFLTERQWRDEA